MSLLHSGSTAVSGEVLAEGVDFDGTYDYLSRSTDLVGASSSKTFTFSFWVYNSASSLVRVIDIGSLNFECYITGGTLCTIKARNPEATTILNMSFSGLAYNTWNHVLVSLDISNTTKRFVYVNGIIASVSYDGYTNDNIMIRGNTSYIGISSSLSSKLKGRLSNVFLSYDYIDLSIEANRRIFISSDGKPT